MSWEEYPSDVYPPWANVSWSRLAAAPAAAYTSCVSSQVASPQTFILQGVGYVFSADIVREIAAGSPFKTLGQTNGKLFKLEDVGAGIWVNHTVHVRRVALVYRSVLLFLTGQVPL